MVKVKILEGPNRLLAEEFLKTTPSGDFLQSLIWEEVCQEDGFKTIPLGAFDKGQLVGFCLLILKPVIFSRYYFYSPRGPVLDYQSPRAEEIFETLLNFVAHLAKKERALFWRLSPKIEVSPWREEEFAFLKSYGFTEPKILIRQKEPEGNLILDLEPSAEELLQKMHPKTRYNIRLAQRKGIKVKEGTLAEEKIFYQLALKTSQRKGIKLFNRQHYQNIIKTLIKHQTGQLLIASYQNQPLAAGIFAFWANKAIYLHGGSSYEYRHLMAPYGLFWQSILAAKARGLKWYDFGGISPANEPEHPWAGISRFKRGFGGKEVYYLGALDFVFDPKWYRALSLAADLKRTLRGS